MNAPKKVLFAEDQREILELTVKFVEERFRYSIEVITASNPYETLEKIQTVELLVTDYNFHLAFDREVPTAEFIFHSLHERGISTPCLVFSASPFDLSHLKIYSNLKEIIEKPDFKKLMASIERELGMEGRHWERQ